MAVQHDKVVESWQEMCAHEAMMLRTRVQAQRACALEPDTPMLIALLLLQLLPQTQVGAPAGSCDWELSACPWNLLVQSPRTIVSALTFALPSVVACSCSFACLIALFCPSSVHLTPACSSCGGCCCYCH